MACCKLKIHPVALVLIFFGLLSWFVALGGLAASTHFCYSQDGATMNVTINGATGNSTLVVNTPGGCVSAFSLPWWAIWFELFILLAMLGTCFIDAFDKARYIYLAYLAMSSFFLTIGARDFITQSIVGGGVSPSNYNLDAYNAAAAGCIMLAVANYALIIFIGLGATTTIPDVQMAQLTQFTQNKFGFRPREQKYEPSSTQGF